MLWSPALGPNLTYALSEPKSPRSSSPRGIGSAVDAEPAETGITGLRPARTTEKQRPDHRESLI